ncbi:DUF4158 domain-containing protein [Hyphococcus luteus]|uniref:DUF4158 domain-containing protein n=1 Tax=Hyphococcus luteus TaxID=2058213 RepID=A0A2S7K5A4_9PROT|nr:DUF4158 domain-containing protein [Marinicaulis flavus]PQA87694.1 hypothetical protein CW354_04830 [Marinicaulis flavus]
MAHVAGQLGVCTEHYTQYAERKETMLEHHWQALGHLELRPFKATDIKTSVSAAAEAALSGEGGKTIVEAVSACLAIAGVAPPGP